MRLVSGSHRLVRSATSLKPFYGPLTIQTRPLSHTRPCRAKDDSADKSAAEEKDEQKRLEKNNPMLARWRARNDKPEESQSQEQRNQSRVNRNAVTSSSIFDEVDERAATVESTSGKLVFKKFLDRDPELMKLVLDPAPKSRMRWQAKMKTRTVRRRGRLNKTELMARTERRSLTKSHWLRTSVKKLGALARQIAGKRIEDAIAQMRFSSKKVARDVKDILELARDEAIVKRGMGLGKVMERKGTPIQIQLKDGTKRKIEDRSGIYIDQAWVGRGTYRPEPEFRARGRVNMLRHPHTSITVLLKEESTLVREAAERQKKLERKKVWVQLPDRPVTNQHQYCLW